MEFFIDLIGFIYGKIKFLKISLLLTIELLAVYDLNISFVGEIMNLKDLRYLVAVSEYQHFGKAAEFCYVSQPTLSGQIKKLEDSLGVKLIERTNKNVFITPLGKEIVEKAKQLLNQADELTAYAKASRDPLAGSLRIGTIPTIAPYLLPVIIPEIKKCMPDLKPLLFEDQTHRIVKKMNDGELDMLILAVPVETGKLEVENLFHEPFYLAAPADHDLANKDNVSLNDIHDETILLLEEGHCLRDHALEFCNISQSDDELAFRATSLETLRQMVASKAGITLLPALSVTNKAVSFNSELISYKEFNDSKIGRDIAVIYRKNTVRVDAIEKLTEIIKSCVPEEWLI